MRYARKPAVEQAAVRDAIDRVRSAFASLAPGDPLVRLVDALADNEEVMRSTDIVAGNAARDRMIAGNIEWVAGHLLAPGKRAVFLAHNGHVAREGDVTDAYRTVGALLDERLGRTYAPIGMLFSGGTLRAVDATATPPSREPRVLTVRSLETDLARGFTRAGRTGLAALDLTAAPPGVVATWLDEPRRNWHIGGVYHPAIAVEIVRLRELYDLVIFVGASTPTHSLDATDK